MRRDACLGPLWPSGWAILQKIHSAATLSQHGQFFFTTLSVAADYRFYNCSIYVPCGQALLVSSNERSEDHASFTSQQSSHTYRRKNFTTRLTLIHTHKKFEFDAELALIVRTRWIVPSGASSFLIPTLMSVDNNVRIRVISNELASLFQYEIINAGLRAVSSLSINARVMLSAILRALFCYDVEMTEEKPVVNTSKMGSRKGFWIDRIEGHCKGILKISNSHPAIKRPVPRGRCIEELILCDYFSMDDQMDTSQRFPDTASSFGKSNAGCTDNHLCIYWA
ncbi:hypothetical protein TSAR_007280 [Trichomalopsis sarcophagae]|uniref:Uncharacterized protein n=1 Tax=Trichomalopsis sarcophagae TaxID=543379 RepID=A0A232F3V0_9HYME|nr:hypothetical protein TSAR_007280 [Trichomalopsis sarcophagae]